MEPVRRMIEGFLRGRYGLAELGTGFARLLAVPVLIGAMLVVGWLLVGPLLTIPRISSDGPVVRNGVAVVVVCGKKRLSGGMDEAFFERMDAATKYAPEPRTGTWGHEERGACTVFYHHPPGLEQRQNRQERAANLSVSGEMLATERARRSESQLERLPVVEKLPVDER